MQLSTSKSNRNPLIFEQTSPGNCAVGLPESDVPGGSGNAHSIPSSMLRSLPPALPEVGELSLVRHFTRLAQRCMGIDTNFYPLGSCTMKYNPRINERVAAMPGFAQVHPYQDPADLQGLLELLYRLRTYLAEISGLAEVTLQPAAGAHGEMTGLMLINAYHRDRGQNRHKVLTPDSAHGTNPATCTICSREAVTIASRPDGRVDLDDLRSKVDEDTAALMITNPNTVGVFDEHIFDIAEILHKRGALFYLDGANMNAILGITRPGDFGIDVMHYNTHKTFSTPHGGGGPGAGPVAVAERLIPYLPVPQVVKRADGTFDWDSDRPKSIGKVRSFFGQIGVLVRAYTYIRALGADGLRNVSDKAVLSANYLAARVKHRYKLPFPPPYAHEFIALPEFDPYGVTETDIAKRLLDFGFHPPTISFPIHHCLMIEPTETESKAELDSFVDALLRIADEATNEPQVLKGAPYQMPVARMDEVAANRKPNVVFPEG